MFNLLQEKYYKNENIIRRIVYIAILFYVLDIILWGAGVLNNISGISMRMLFFVIAFVGCVPGVCFEYKKYIKNPYCIVISLFFVMLLLSLLLGIHNDNNLMIMVSDFKGFLNFLIVFPMMYACNTEDKIVKLIKIANVFLVILAVLGLLLSFYMHFSDDLQTQLYSLLDVNRICGITMLTSNITRIFFHTASRLFFVAFMFLMVFCVIEKTHKFIRVLCLAVLMTASFISYTRSIYLAIFACFCVFLIVVHTLFNKYKKLFMRSVLYMACVTIIIVGGFSVLQHENMVSVAVTRCLLTFIDVSPDGSQQLADNKDNLEVDIDDLHGNELEDNKSEQNDKHDGNNAIDKLNNMSAELNNLSIRDIRKTNAIRNFTDSPFYGKGLGVENDLNGETIEYFYWDFLSKMGFIGLGLFIAPFCIAIYNFVKRSRKIVDRKSILLFAALLSVLFLLIISYFNPCMNTSVGLMVYALLVSIDSVEEKH